MTDKEWNEVQETLRAGSDARLLIDGYKVELRIIKFRNYSVGVLPFVNGEYKSEWLLNDCEERRRFCRIVVYRLCDGSTCYDYRAVWTSFEFMKIHFERENKSIEILRGED